MVERDLHAMGLAARYEKASWTSNPFEPGTAERAAWLAGWQEAEKVTSPLRWRPGADLLDQSLGAQAIVNPSNCVGAMGAGVPLAIRNRYPLVARDFAAACERGDVAIGRPYLAHVDKGSGEVRENETGFAIIHVPTKRNWREPSKAEDVDASLQGLVALLRQHPEIRSLALPLLGAGRGGLDGDQMARLIDRRMAELAEAGLSVTVTAREPDWQAQPRITWSEQARERQSRHERAEKPHAQGTPADEKPWTAKPDRTGRAGDPTTAPAESTDALIEKAATLAMSKAAGTEDTRPVMGFRNQFRWLSNFQSGPVYLDGEPYPTVEHAYQAAKTNNVFQRRDIAKLASPGEAKKAGRRLEIRTDWESAKVAVMDNLLRQKFSDRKYGDRLKGTGTRPLVELNTWGDVFWGQVESQGALQGQNTLGRLLENIRGDLQEGRDLLRLGKPVLEAGMYFSFNGRQRPEVAAQTTFDAILSGDRTATTRFDTWPGTERWREVSPGDVIRFFSEKGNRGRSVDVVITGRHDVDLGKMADHQLERWSQLEGWSPEAAKRDFASAGRGIQLTYVPVADYEGEQSHKMLTDWVGPGLEIDSLSPQRMVAGIGSRQTPPAVQEQMVQIAGELAKQGIGLSSGKAKGADSAFERGHREAGGQPEIFTANDRLSIRHYEIADHFHPVFPTLSDYAQRLQARNASQLFGGDLTRRVMGVIAWTEGGAIKGGTGQALRIAKSFAIPVINLGDPRWRHASVQDVVEQVHAWETHQPRSERAPTSIEPLPKREYAITPAPEAQAPARTAQEAAGVVGQKFGRVRKPAGGSALQR